ncbi:unnamed protein product [Pneumocystis jirovecii]|uniref:NUC153 domain-containing protein n=1 Tax=Pneumocystis jirovecii TaxID=42068 RepID=L0PH54_PNEJI|nr:unnamed protein product [Pneumocystis jirovecii]
MDERFPVNSDPRFRRSKKRGRVVLDDRFFSVLDPSFSEEPEFDRYGRRLIDKKGDVESMRKLYILPDNDKFKKNNIPRKKGNNREVLDKEVVEQSTSSKNSDISSEDDTTSSDEQSSSLSSEDLELVDPDPILEIPRGKMTSRLAAVNLDWDHIRSVDIFAALGSFVPRNGQILSVRVYPSEFGKERMEKEDVEGPPKNIFLANSCKKEFDKSFEEKQSLRINQDNFNDKFQDYDDGTSVTDDISSDENDINHISSDEDDTSDTSDEEKVKRNLLKGNDGNDFDMTQLRKYQLERLRYYYAIIVCDSVNTAKCIYEQCDGREYEASANFFDLRFVPDEESFDSIKFRDECLSLPENYVPDEFVTDALKHSKVKLMWDNDDPVYVQMVKRAFSGNEINENDFRTYLASTDSEASDIEKTKEKYRSLLLETEKDFLSTKDVVGDMQVTFTPGIDDKKSEEISCDYETTLEKYKRKEKERKEKKREKRLSKLKESSNVIDDAKKNQTDLGFDDPFFSEKPSISSKKTKRKVNKKKEFLDDKEKAELELLMMEDGGFDVKEVDHFDMKEVLKMEKKKKKKHMDTEGLQNDFEMDVNDPRFASIYSSHHFAIDPTNPHFKKTKSMTKLLEERRRRINIQDKI